MAARIAYPRELAARYRPEKAVGRGTMGVVLKARDLEYDQDVAVKLLLPDPEQPELLHRFMREARVLGSIRSPHVVSIFGAGEAEGCHYLVMEWLEGETLTTLAKTSQYSEAQTARLLEGLLQGLASAHDVGVLHRDVKPSNVVLCRDGRPVLIDFGLALGRFDPIRYTQSWMVVGTPFFMAPELVMGQPASVQSDLFAAGLTAAWLWTGLACHAAAAGSTPSVADVLSSLESGAYYEEAARQLEGRGALGPVLLRSLAREPGLRFASAREMLRALEPIAYARRPAPAARVDPPASRRVPWLMALLAALLLAAVLYLR